MAPEQTTGEKDIDARADIWALGVIVYECLAGARPVEGSGIGQVVMKLMTEGIKPIDQVVSNLPPRATALVMRMLARPRSDRPQDLREVQAVLAQFTAVKPRPFGAPGALRSGDEDVTAPPQQQRTPAVDTQSPQSIPNGVRRAPRRSVLAVGAAGAVLVTAFVGWRVSAPGRSPATMQGLSVDGTSVAAPVASLPPVLPATQVDAATAAAPVMSLSVAASPAPANVAATHPPRVDPPRQGPAKVAAAGSASSRPIETPVAPPPPPITATAKPNPGGLVEKPPF
jgi:serine/threonine-protein kinase